MLDGSLVAIVTPMKDGKVDEQSLRRLLRTHVVAGTAGVVPAGCTGEAATLSASERARVLDVCLEEVGGSLPVVPGTGSNSTAETVRMSVAAERAGASGVLVITPYYNKPTPEAQYVHYRAVAEEIGIPVMLYNVPSRTGVNMLPETVARLSEVEGIVAIKEAAGSVDQVSAILELCEKQLDLLDSGRTHHKRFRTNIEKIQQLAREAKRAGQAMEGRMTYTRELFKLYAQDLGYQVRRVK